MFGRNAVELILPLGPAPSLDQPLWMLSGEITARSFFFRKCADHIISHTWPTCASIDVFQKNIRRFFLFFSLAIRNGPHYHLDVFYWVNSWILRYSTYHMLPYVPHQMLLLSCVQTFFFPSFLCFVLVCFWSSTIRWSRKRRMRYGRNWRRQRRVARRGRRESRTYSPVRVRLFPPPSLVVVIVVGGGGGGGGADILGHYTRGIPTWQTLHSLSVDLAAS